MGDLCQVLFAIAEDVDIAIFDLSADRLHPGDIAIRELLTLTLVLVFGIRPEVYILYRIITPFFAYFTHANISLPPKVDRALSWVIVTPHMHKFHHHFERPWTDTNFGNIFSLWDRIFGTLVYEDRDDIRYGLDIMDDSRDLDFWYQMKAPIDPAIDTTARRGLLQ